MIIAPSLTSSDLMTPDLITIDGPAGAGKSTAATLLARRLTETLQIRFDYLDTGSMYRAAALLGIRSSVDENIPEQLEHLVVLADISFAKGCLLLNGDDVTEAVRSPEVTEKTWLAADNPVIRSNMADRQRMIARTFLEDGKGLVTEGRDQGTVVFPDASYKFFLTASLEERARRRLGEWKQRGIAGNLEEIYRQIMERDERDRTRLVAPLCEPPDAHRIVSDGMTIEEVAEQMLTICLARSCPAHS